MKIHPLLFHYLAGLLALLCTAGMASAAIAPGRESPSGEDHSHMPVAVPAGVPKVEFSLELHRDVLSGFNLTLLLHNYRIGPPPAGVPSMQDLMAPTVDRVTGNVEGHAHLYVNGTKIQRVYGGDVHLPATLFREGTNQISVSLNNHGHMYWTQEGREVIASLFIDPAVEQPIVYRFASFPVQSEKVSK
jgi:hypothetical protein